jgi:ribosomal protein L32
MNNLEVCKKCGTVVKNNITEPDKVVIIVKVICKDCVNNKNKNNENKNINQK